VCFFFGYDGAYLLCFCHVGKKDIKNANSRAPVAHTCNSSYSGGRDQEDHGSKPARANSSRDPISKNPSQKGLVEFKPQYHKKKKKKKKKNMKWKCKQL
jgi:hypothetical protein